MKSSILGFSALAIIFASCAGTQLPSEITLSKAELQDKIMGAWAGQTIGCTYGGPTEFRYSGTMINDNIPIEWPDGYIKWYHDNFRDFTMTSTWILHLSMYLIKKALTLQ